MKSGIKFSAIIIVFRLEYEEAAAHQEQTGTDSESSRYRSRDHGLS